jgi:hypothetical protein
VKKPLGLPGPIETLGAIKSVSLHFQGLRSQETLGVIKNRNLFEHRVETDFGIIHNTAQDFVRFKG